MLIPRYLTTSLCADSTAKEWASGTGLGVDSSVDGDITARYSQPMFRREHRAQLGLDSSHYCSGQLAAINRQLRADGAHTLMRLFLHATQPFLDFRCALRVAKGRCFVVAWPLAPLSTRSTLKVVCIRTRSPSKTSSYKRMLFVFRYVSRVVKGSVVDKSMMAWRFARTLERLQPLKSKVDLLCYVSSIITTTPSSKHHWSHRMDLAK